MAWTITRLVGCEHILNIANAAQTPVANSLNPDGEATGVGRKGKQKVSFILNNSNLTTATDEDASVSFTIDSGIAFQSPPMALATAADAAAYSLDTPLDLSAFIPIMHVTPLSPRVTADPNGFIAWEAKPYLVYNQDSVVGNRDPEATAPAATLVNLPGTDPNPNGQLTLVFGVANAGPYPVTPDDGYAGSFLIEIDFSHSIAS